MSSSNAPWVEHDYTYDDYTNGLNTNGYHNLTQEVVKGSNLPSSLYPLTKTWTYTVNNNNGQGGWTFYTVDAVTHSEVDDAGGNKWLCQSTTYDEGSGNTKPTAGWPTTVQADSGSNCSSPDTSYTDYDVYGNVVAMVDPFAVATPSLYNNEGCTPTSAIAVASTGWNSGRYTACTNYDSGHYFALPTSGANAFNQTSSNSYDPNQGNILQSSTDPNSQVTSYNYSYDPSGNRTVQVTVPPDTQNTHYTTQSSSYSGCPGNNGLPCYEVDSLSYQYNAVHATTFYDSEGRAVETITPDPASTPPQGSTAYYTVVYTSYDDAQHSTFQSNPFVIAINNPQPAHLSYIDPNSAKDYNGQTPGGTATYYDALGRTIAVQDPLFGSQQEPGIACSTVPPYNQGQKFTACTNYSYGQLPPSISSDQNYYSIVTGIDPDQHVSLGYLDALGRTVYTLQESGTYGGTLSTHAFTTIQYNVLDEPTSVQVQDLAPQSGQSITSVTTAQYDSLGRLTQVADPDRGTHTYSIDADGRVYADASSSTHTIGYVYDLLGRIGCVQDAAPSFSPTGICTSGANPYVQNSYDQTFLGTQGTTDFPTGRLGKSVTTTYYPDTGSPAVSVTQLYQHDQRGRLTQENMSIGLPTGWKSINFTALPTYILQPTYNDADQVTTTTTSTNPSGQGFTTTQAYDSTSGVLYGLSNSSSSTPNLATIGYNAQALPSSLNYQTSTGGQLAAQQFGYDGNLRVQSLATTWQGGSGNPSNNIFSQTLNYDPASNLINLSTAQAVVPSNTNSGGTETQVFCYDEQNRLVWSGNSGTPACTGNGSPGTPTGSIAAYTNTYVYTHLGQLWQGPLNGSSSQYQYLYCSSSQPHQLTGLYALGSTCSNSSGQGYASSYDAWGNVTGRTYSSTTAALSYDHLNRFVEWNASSTNREWYAYDANGNRVLKRSTNTLDGIVVAPPFHPKILTAIDSRFIL